MEQNDILLDDAFFAEYANEMKQDEKKGKGQTFTRDYDDLSFAACEPGKNKIFRFIGIPPKTTQITRRNFDPKLVIMSDVKSDDGKRFVLRLPPREDVAEKNHIVHRLYDRITKVTWVKTPGGGKATKVFDYEVKYPELFNKAQKMGFTMEDGESYKYVNGLKGSRFLVYNVIDRQDSWCKENKHTKILANSATVDKEGRIWAKPGIKEYGFADKIIDLIAKYKLPEDYDIAIKKIPGQQTAPWELRNASVYAEKDLMEELKNDDGTLPEKSIIVIGPLTDEEKAYEKYDLDKLYGPTTYNQIQKRMSAVFKECDACLGTKFYDELVSLVEEEKKHFDAIYAKAETETATKEVEATNEAVAAKEETPTPRRRTAVVGPADTGLSEEKIALLKGWSKLSDAERSLIQDVILNSDGSIKDIKWVQCEETSELLACDCSASSPSTFNSCPLCGASFVEN